MRARGAIKTEYYDVTRLTTRYQYSWPLSNLHYTRLNKYTNLLEQNILPLFSGSPRYRVLSGKIIVFDETKFFLFEFQIYKPTA